MGIHRFWGPLHIACCFFDSMSSVRIHFLDLDIIQTKRASLLPVEWFWETGQDNLLLIMIRMNFLGGKIYYVPHFVVLKESTFLSDLISSSTNCQRDNQQHHSIEKGSLSDGWCQVLKERKIQLGGWKNRFLLELLCYTSWDASNLHFVILFYSMRLQHQGTYYSSCAWYWFRSTFI